MPLLQIARSANDRQSRRFVSQQKRRLSFHRLLLIIILAIQTKSTSKPAEPPKIKHTKKNSGSPRSTNLSIAIPYPQLSPFLPLGIRNQRKPNAPLSPALAGLSHISTYHKQRREGFDLSSNKPVIRSSSKPKSSFAIS